MQTENDDVRPAPERRSLSRWLNENAGAASWIQAVGIVATMIYGTIQIQQATSAIEITAQANQIALRTNTSDLLVDINRAALDYPEVSPNQSRTQRLHLMRLHYFYRSYDLYEAGIFDEDQFQAETSYLFWTAQQEGFAEVWTEFRDQYNSRFRGWVDAAVPMLPAEK